MQKLDEKECRYLEAVKAMLNAELQPWHSLYYTIDDNFYMFRDKDIEASDQTRIEKPYSEVYSINFICTNPGCIQKLHSIEIRVYSEIDGGDNDELLKIYGPNNPMCLEFEVKLPFGEREFKKFNPNDASIKYLWMALLNGNH